jgi:hypothetical protein
VANTFGFSFFGFLASLLPRFFPLDIVIPFRINCVRDAART